MYPFHNNAHHLLDQNTAAPHKSIKQKELITPPVHILRTYTGTPSLFFIPCSPLFSFFFQKKPVHIGTPGSHHGLHTIRMEHDTLLNYCSKVQGPVWASVVWHVALIQDLWQPDAGQPALLLWMHVNFAVQVVWRETLSDPLHASVSLHLTNQSPPGYLEIHQFNQEPFIDRRSRFLFESVGTVGTVHWAVVRSRPNKG